MKPGEQFKCPTTGKMLEVVSSGKRPGCRSCRSCFGLIDDQICSGLPGCQPKDSGIGEFIHFVEVTDNESND